MFQEYGWIFCYLGILLAFSGCEGAARLEFELAPPYVYEQGNKCDVDSGCLKLEYTTEDSGQDNLGQFFVTSYSYITPLSTPVTLSERIYEDGTIAFTQDFPDGLQGCSTGDKDKVISAYPRVKLPSAEETTDLRYITPGGYMTGWTLFAHGSLNQDLDKFRDGEDGGIVILYRQDGDYVSSTMMSSLLNPMATNVWLDRGEMTLDWGIQGLAEELPKFFNIQVIIVPSNYSINQNILEWGSKLKTFSSSTKLADPSAEYVSYYTDNGASHYYNPLPYTNFRDTILNIHNYTVQNNIPIRRLQLDSWWYHKGAGGGVKNWTAIESVIPEGIANLNRITGWPIIAHNRYFSSDTDYAQQNGGPYPFAIDEESEKALPLDSVFWDDLFDEALEWGMETYEQDWLDRQYMYMRQLHTNVTLGSDWLNQMGGSALERDLYIQYCMSLTRELLHSVSLPAVTQIRVSDDYMLSPDQWRIGTTSMFAHALGLLPFKDVFWTSKENVNVVFNDCEMILPETVLPPWDLTYKYGGRVNVSSSGKPCVPWANFGWDDKYYGSGMALNVCRNPENIRDGAFCYTKAGFDIPEEEWEWEYCDVLKCLTDCYLFNGYTVLYEGNQNITQSGQSCVDWDGEYSIHGAKCRNPDNDVAPWCYVSEDRSQKDYCDNKCPEAKEYNPYLQAAVSTLTGGPYGVGDRAENLDKFLIMKSCDAEGRLLHPSKPLTVIDKYYFSNEYKEVWTGYSTVDGLQYGIIFLAEIENDLTLSAYDLSLEVAMAGDVLLWQNHPEGPESFLMELAFGEPAQLPSCGGFLNFCLYHTSPFLETESGGVYLLGERSKWVPVSLQRITEVSASPNSVTVSIQGVPGEEVVISFYDTEIFDVTCNFVAYGTMIIDTSTRICL